MTLTEHIRNEVRRNFVKHRWMNGLKRLVNGLLVNKKDYDMYLKLTLQKHMEAYEQTNHTT